MSDRLREWIEGDGVYLIDGGMGTVLYESGVFVNQCYDELNLTEPDRVLGVHADYVRAGAQLIETNTFGANPVKLEPFGLEPSAHEINVAAAHLARQAAGERAAVLGAMGPLGIRIEPWGPTSVDEAAELFGRQVAGLAEGGVDGFMLETFSDLDELLQAVRAVREVAGAAPVFAQMTFGDAGHTEYGATIETAAAALEGAGADVIGLNCSVGPSSMLFGVERMAAATSRPVSALPNAGLPRDIGDRKIYLASPEYMARYARRMAAAGARFVGGCCGTSPEHTRLTATLLGTNGPGPARVSVSSPGEADGRAATEPPPLAGRSALGGRLARGEFVGAVELTPPHGWDPGELLAGAGRLRDAGVHTVHIVDGPAHRSRIAALPAAIVIERELGMETVPHYSCRDRNMLGMLSDLLGAAAAGLRNVFLVTGDPPRGGPYDTGGVYDIDSIGLTNIVRQLNLGLDPGGKFDRRADLVREGRRRESRRRRPRGGDPAFRLEGRGGRGLRRHAAHLRSGEVPRLRARDRRVRHPASRGPVASVYPWRTRSSWRTRCPAWTCRSRWWSEWRRHKPEAPKRPRARASPWLARSWKPCGPMSPAPSSARPETRSTAPPPCCATLDSSAAEAARQRVSESFDASVDRITLHGRVARPSAGPVERLQLGARVASRFERVVGGGPRPRGRCEGGPRRRTCPRVLRVPGPSRGGRAGPRVAGGALP